jgi:hypothetical protein
MTWIIKTDEWLTESESLNNAQLVINHFTGTDWNVTALCGLCGNMRHESSINPDIWEFGYNHSWERGFGLVQWTPASKYINWAQASGLDWTLGDSQLSRIDYEVNENIQWIANGHARRYGLETKYDFSFSEYRQNLMGLSIEEMTEAFMWNYEGPSYSAGRDSLPGRQAFALKCLNQLNFEGGPVGPTPPPNDGNEMYHLLLAGVFPVWNVRLY